MVIISLIANTAAPSARPVKTWKHLLPISIPPLHQVKMQSLLNTLLQYSLFQDRGWSFLFCTAPFKFKHLLSPEKWKFCLKGKRISNIHKIPKCTIFFKWTQIMQSSLGYIYDFHKELDANTSILEFLYRKIHLCGNKQAFIWEIYSPLPDCPFTVHRNCQQNQVTNHCFESSHLYLSVPSTTEG